MDPLDVWGTQRNAERAVRYVRKKLNRYAWDDGCINNTCILEGRKWRDVYKEYAQIGYELLNMPFNENVIEKYMDYHRYPHVLAGGSVAEFAVQHPKGKYAVVTDAVQIDNGLAERLTAVIDGTVWGSYDAREAHTKYAYDLTSYLPYHEDGHIMYAEYTNTEWKGQTPSGGQITAVVNAMAADDCLINTLCIVTGRKWREVYKECMELGYKYQRMPHSYRVLREFVKAHGMHEKRLAKGHKTIGQFKKDYPVGKYILACRGHVAAVIDGITYNAFPENIDFMEIMNAYKAE